MTEKPEFDGAEPIFPYERDFRRADSLEGTSLTQLVFFAVLAMCVLISAYLQFIGV